MASRKKQKLILFIFMGVILFGAVFLLGFFQVQSVVRSGDTTRDSMRRALFGTMGRIVSELFTDERQLLQSLDLTFEEFAAEDFSHLDRTLDSWYRTSGAGTRVRGIYIFSGKDPEYFYFHIPGNSDFIRVGEMPRDLPVFTLPGSLSRVFIAMELDLDAIYGERLSDVLAQWDDIYSWKLVPQGTTSGASLGMEGIGYGPEVTIPLFLSPQIFMRDSRRIRLDPPHGGGWGIGPPANEGRTMMTPEDERTWGILEVYFRDGPVEDIIRKQIFINLFASSLALILIAGGYLLLYKLYRRSEVQREKEQEFVAAMSHELRTPLAVISSAADNLARGIVAGDRLPGYGRMIARESRRLEDMIESVLYFSGLQNGSARGLVREDLDLSRFLGEIRERFIPRARESDIRLEMDAGTDLPRLRINRESLTLILENLLNNALLHAYPPGFAVSSEERAVICRVRVEDKKLIITVQDRGRGIPHREQKRIFNAFERGEESRRKQIPGSGLGLHLCRRVTNRMGGRISVESPVRRAAGGDGGGGFFGDGGASEGGDGGAIFEVILPVEILAGKEGADESNFNHRG